MNLFESVAHAAPAGGAPADAGLINILFLGGFILIFYFLLIRPQSKKAKEHREMVAALAKGDEVVTGGGLLGRISKVGENFIELDIADGVTVKVQRQAVSNLMPKGTIKGL